MKARMGQVVADELRYNGTLVTIRRAAEMLGLTERAVLYSIETRKFPFYFNVGGMFLIPKDAIERLLSEKRRKT